MWIRFRGREHHDDLVDVRREDAFAVPAARRAPRELGPPRQDLGDRPFVVARRTLEVDVVADGELEGLRRGAHRVSPKRPVGPSPAIRFLQSATQRSVDRVAILGPNLPDAAGSAEHHTANDDRLGHASPLSSRMASHHRRPAVPPVRSEIN
jgi:hypothetical protein